MTTKDGFVLAKPRHDEVGTALVREYTANHNRIGLIYRARDVLVSHFALEDAALVVEGSEFGVQVFWARRRAITSEHSWLLSAESLSTTASTTTDPRNHAQPRDDQTHTAAY